MKHSQIVFFLFFCMVLHGQRNEMIAVAKVIKLMGSRFEITVVSQNEALGYININEAIAEIQRIEKKISSWDMDSETAAINRFAGIRAVEVSDEVFQLIQRALKISEITDGAFDISYASLDKIWKFDGSMDQMPTAAAVANSIAKIGHEKVVLDAEKSTVFLPEKGMKIGFGALGKGYAADMAKKLLQAKGVPGGIINASGDLTTWGTQETGKKWLVGLTDPADNQKVFSWLPVVESSVATSGNYEKYVEFNGEQYTHIIDPRTGYPVKGLKSVSIFAKDAELCDALATAVFVMGRDSGIHLINQLDGVEVVLVDNEDKIHKSSGIILDSAK